jgi:hypothetical protein
MARPTPDWWIEVAECELLAAQWEAEQNFSAFGESAARLAG